MIAEASTTEVPSDEPLLGFAEIAALAGVKIQTAWEWKKRNLLPEPTTIEPPNSAKWKKSVAENWLTATGRLMIDADWVAERAKVSRDTVLRWIREEKITKPDSDLYGPKWRLATIQTWLAKTGRL